MLSHFMTSGSLIIWSGQPQQCGWLVTPLLEQLQLHLQAGYFGLYVDSTFERGMSRPCSTYNNQCLAADEVRQ